MTIYKARDFVEVYRAKAKAGSINELTGRVGRPDLTEYVIDQILFHVPLRTTSVVVDIGCGDGRFLQLAARQHVDGFRGRLIGLLPTEEEIGRVRDHLLRTKQKAQELIAIERGVFEQTGIPDNYADIVVSNSTFMFLRDKEHLAAVLSEIARISKPTAIVFMGEVPAADETLKMKYGNSILAWLWHVLRERGIAHFVVALKQLFRAMVTSEPFIIAPKKLFFIGPDQFNTQVDQAGFEIIRSFRHREIDQQGKVIESPTRWDYIARRRSVQPKLPTDATQ
jgi:SAM-dependent methyltransferase